MCTFKGSQITDTIFYYFTRFSRILMAINIINFMIWYSIEYLGHIDVSIHGRENKSVSNMLKPSSKESLKYIFIA